MISEWQENRAIPDFTMGFAVGRFIEGGGRAGKAELRYLSAKYTGDQMRQIFHSTPKALQFFAKKAGVPYPAKTYSQVLVDGNPEQDLGEFTLLPESYGSELLTHPAEEWLLAHELAHQWWGIGVACREWSDFWLNEGMATFMADVYLGEEYGKARYEHEIEIARQTYEGLRAAGKDRALCYRDWKSERDAGGRLPYFKGAWVLHLLKQRLGEEVFWRGFRGYTRANWGRSATSRDLQSAMEKAAGSRLDEFFDQWVYR
jgi:aminopeptidase N